MLLSGDEGTVVRGREMMRQGRELLQRGKEWVVPAWQWRWNWNRKRKSIWTGAKDLWEFENGLYDHVVMPNGVGDIARGGGDPGLRGT
jgi:hypothetical protein